MNQKCLYCYQSLEEREQDFHASCAKKMFGSKTAPILELDKQRLESLAKEIVIKSIAVTGVQPKLSLQLEKSLNDVPRLTIVGIYGDYILKPPSNEFPELPQNEDLTMHLAEAVGIKTAMHSLIRLQSGELAYVTKRFDRVKGQKISVEDFNQLSENLTEYKYRGSVEKLGKLVQKYTSNIGIETQRLFELVVFSYLTGNADMHLKNYSIIQNDFGEYELSPAYDLLNTKLVMPEDQEEYALTINGKKSKLNKNDFYKLAQSLNLQEKVVQTIYKRFIKILPKWKLLISQSFLSFDMQQQYLEQLEHKFQRIFEGK